MHSEKQLTQRDKRRRIGMLIIDIAAIGGSLVFINVYVALAFLIYGFACYWYGMTIWQDLQ